MKTFQRILVVTTLAATALLSAQTPMGDRTGGPRQAGPGHRGGPSRGHPVVRAIDADKNGILSAAELGGAPAAIAALDRNGDRTVSADELRPVRPAGAAERPADAPERVAKQPRTAADGNHARPIDPVMLALDADKDGALQVGEIANAAVSLAVLDVNKDGQLTRDEVHPLPPVQ